MGFSSVKTVTVSATASAVSYRCRLRGVIVNNYSAAVRVFTVRDGSPTAATLLTFSVPATSNYQADNFPGAGILAASGLWADPGAGAAASVEATLFYE